MGLAAIADDERHAVLIIKVTPFKTGRSVKVDFLDRVRGLAYGILLAQFSSIVFTILPAHRTDHLNLFGSEFCQTDHFGDELHAVYEDMQVIRQVVIQYLATLFNDVWSRFGGLTGTYLDLLQVGSVDFANGQMLQFL